MTNIFKQIYIRTTGYSYTNMGRLFLRLFIGIMLMQFGVRQLMHYHEASHMFPSVLGMDSPTTMSVMIVIEILCSFFIMAGFCTRLMVIPPFMGIYFFILLVGPGKISVDYFLSLHFIHSDNQSESELEEV